MKFGPEKVIAATPFVATKKLYPIFSYTYRYFYIRIFFRGATKWNVPSDGAAPAA
jgi:hypothetical protein